MSHVAISNQAPRPKGNQARALAHYQALAEEAEVYRASQEQRYLIETVNDRNARADKRIEAGLSLLVVLAVGIIGGLLVASFMTPCEAGHLCAGGVLVTRTSTPWWRRILRHVQVQYLRMQLRTARFDETTLVCELHHLPAQLEYTRAHIEGLVRELDRAQGSA